MTSQSVNGAMSWLAGRLTSDGSEVAASEFLSHSFIRVFKLVDGAAVVTGASEVGAFVLTGAFVGIGLDVSAASPHPAASNAKTTRAANFVIS